MIDDDEAVEVERLRPYGLAPIDVLGITALFVILMIVIGTGQSQIMRELQKLRKSSKRQE